MIEQENWTYLTAQLHQNESLRPIQLYSLSKLYLILHAKELGRRLKGIFTIFSEMKSNDSVPVIHFFSFLTLFPGTGVTTYSLHPGYVRTNITSTMHKEIPAVISFIYHLAERLLLHFTLKHYKLNFS